MKTSDIEMLQNKRAEGASFAFVSVEIGSEKVSALELYLKLRQTIASPDTAYFERMDGSQQVSTILAFDAVETIRIIEGRAVVERAVNHSGEIPESLQSLSGNPLVAIAAYLGHQMKRPLGGNDLNQFLDSVGVIGYLNFDFVRHIEPRLKQSGYFARLEQDPTTCDGEFRIYRRLVVFDHLSGRAFVQILVRFSGASHAEVGERSLAAHQEANEFARFVEVVAANLVRPGFSERLQIQLARAPLCLNDSSASFGVERFCAGVRKLKCHIRAGDIFQAVLSERFEFDLPVPPLEVFSALCKEGPSPYRFYIENGARVLLGASPEMLIRTDGHEAETHPIAGTRPRGESKRQDRTFARQLRSSVKENAEHLMLVDLARNDLGRVAKIGSVRVTMFREVHRFSHVQHLVSKVQASLRDGTTSLEAVGACFPAGTLSGAPKIRALELLSEIELLPRGFYGGAVISMGFIDGLDSCIAIRCLELVGQRAILRAGAGIVADSRPAAEYAEVHHKLGSLLRAIEKTAQTNSLQCSEQAI